MVTWTALPTARFPCFPCPQPAFLALAHGSESILLYLFALQLLDVDNDLQLVLKKIAKRDPVTKLKAMEELRTLLATKAPEDAAKTLPRWVCAAPHPLPPPPPPPPPPARALCAPGPPATLRSCETLADGPICRMGRSQCKQYARLTLDNDRRVRVAAGQVLGVLAERVGRRLGPHVKMLLGPWVCARFDVSADVAKAASDAFEVGNRPAPRPSPNPPTRPHANGPTALAQTAGLSGGQGPRRPHPRLARDARIHPRHARGADGRDARCAPRDLGPPFRLAANALAHRVFPVPSAAQAIPRQ